mgnify:FL=1
MRRTDRDRSRRSDAEVSTATIEEHLRCLKRALLVNTPNIVRYSREISGPHAQTVYYLSHTIHTEAERENYLTKMKLAYAISPHFVSESTAIRIINAFVDKGFLFEDGNGTSGRGRAKTLRPTPKFYRSYFKTLEGMAKTFAHYGFSHSEEKVQLADMILLTARDGTIMLAHSQKGFFGYELEEITSKSLFDVIAPETIENYSGLPAFTEFFERVFDRLVERDNRISAFWSIIHADGNPFPTNVEMRIGRQLSGQQTLRLSLSSLT